MTEVVEIGYKEILKKILKDLHCKNYKNILDYVDDSKFPDILDFLEVDLEEALEDYDAIDEFGVAVNGFDDEDRINVIEYSGDNGFAIDYMLSADEEILGLMLQLEFVEDSNLQDGLKCVFLGIDYS